MRKSGKLTSAASGQPGNPWITEINSFPRSYIPYVVTMKNDVIFLNLVLLLNFYSKRRLYKTKILLFSCNKYFTVHINVSSSVGKLPTSHSFAPAQSYGYPPSPSLHHTTPQHNNPTLIPPPPTTTIFERFFSRDWGKLNVLLVAVKFHKL